MKQLLLGCALLSTTFGAAAAPTLTAVWSEANAGRFSLFDPSAAVTADNPSGIDVGVDEADFAYGGVRLQTVSGGNASNIRDGWYVYAKEGHVYRVDARPGTVHSPQQVSAVSDACSVHALSDYAVPTRSWLQIHRAGDDALCATTDDVLGVATLFARATATPLIIPGKSVSPVYDATGAITGFVTVETVNGRIQLRHRDATFHHPLVLKNLASAPDFAHIEEFDLRDNFFVVTPAGQTQPRLYRFDPASNQLTPALYTFNAFDPFAMATTDAANLYFADGNRVLRIALDATTAGQAQLVSSAPLSKHVTRVLHSATSTRLVFAAYGDTSSAIYSVPANAAAAKPLVLLSSTTSSGATIDAVAGELVYLHLRNTTTRVGTDGSSPVTTGNSRWYGTVYTTSTRAASAHYYQDPDFVVQNLDDGSTCDLRLINALSGAEDNALGTIPNCEYFFAKGYGRYVTLTSYSRTDGSSNVYSFDVQTQGSLRSVAKVPAVNEEAYFPQ